MASQISPVKSSTPEYEEQVFDNTPRTPFFQKLSVRVALTVLALIAAAGALIGLTSVAKVPELAPLSRVATIPHSAKLDPNHVHQRLILIGDVHGMYHELQKLLKKVEYNREKDVIVFLGDMITKGYDSLGVVDFAIDHNAYCVRGNHEDEILSLYADRHHLSEPQTYPPFASSKTMTAFAEPEATLSPTKGPDLRENGAVANNAQENMFAYAKPTPTPLQNVNLCGNQARDGPLVKKLKPHHIRYLESCPAILQLGQVSRQGIEAVAVHGGLLWSEHELEKQNIVDVLRLRSIVPPDYTTGSEDPDDGIPWFPKWNEEQLTRPKNERYEVFYGHDASKGLQLDRYSKGLDTRCQRGGQLSAYVVRVKHNGRVKEELVQIDC